MKKWMGYEFESSSGKTLEFMNFSKDWKKELKKVLPKELNIVGYTVGHFYISGFVINKETGKSAYFSTSDVRGIQDNWYNHILYRTAQNEKDYSGGFNNYTSLDKLGDLLQKITQ